MKKVLMPVVVVMVIVCAILFVCLTDDVNNGQETSDFNPVGTWKMLVKDGVIVEDVYVEFTASSCKYYSTTDDSQNFESEYTIEGDRVNIKQMGKSFKAWMKTDKTMSLAESKESEWIFIKAVSKDVTHRDFDREKLNGNWTVTYHGGNKVVDEEIKFTENSLTLIKGGTEVKSGAYVWTVDNMLDVSDLGSTFRVYEVDDVIILIDSNNYIWELIKS